MSEAGDRARFLQNVVLPLRRDVTDETLKMYNGMYVGVFELLQARREEIESTVQWVEAVRDYWKARVQVELAIEGVMPQSEAASAAPMTSGGKTAGPDEH
jgi:cobalt-zinc-cadmium efflux system outer membrane protein